MFTGEVRIHHEQEDEKWTTTEQSRRHDEAVIKSRMKMRRNHKITQTNEIHREDMNKCASGHTFHFLVSSALGTLLVSVRSMRTEKHMGHKASSMHLKCVLRHGRLVFRPQIHCFDHIRVEWVINADAHTHIQYVHYDPDILSCFLEIRASKQRLNVSHSLLWFFWGTAALRCRFNLFFFLQTAALCIST